MITKKQKQVFDFIKAYVAKNEYAPSLEDIRQKFNLASVSTAHFHIGKLEESGYLVKLDHHPRSLILKEVASNPLLRPPAQNKSDLGPFPDAKLLNRERKVKDRVIKEKSRGGSKYKNATIAASHVKGIEKFTNQIICGDSEEELKKLPSGSVDIIITSPPYNFGLNYEGDDKDDALHWSLYFKKLNDIWKQCVRVLKPGGRLCLNLQPLFSDYIPTHHLMSKQLLDLGLLWKGEILWEKNNYNCKYTAWGSWKSPSMPYLKYTWEFVEVFSKETHKKAGERDNIDITGDEFKKWVYAKWSIAPERRMKEFEHPAMFPEELVNRLLKLFSYRGDIVLDPFNGAGTTTLVAAKTGRRYIGLDISEQYCAVAKKRIADIQPTLL